MNVLSSFLSITSLVSCNNKDLSHEVNEEIVGNNFSYYAINPYKNDKIIRITYDLKNNLNSNLYIDFKTFTMKMNNNTCLPNEASDKDNEEFNKPIYLIAKTAITFSLTYDIDNAEFDSVIFSCSLENTLVDGKAMNVKVAEDQFVSSDTELIAKKYAGYSIPKDETKPFVSTIYKNEVFYMIESFSLRSYPFVTELVIINNKSKDYSFSKNEFNFFVNGYLQKKSDCDIYSDSFDTIPLTERIIPSNSRARVTLAFTTIDDINNIVLFIGNVNDNTCFTFADNSYTS